MCGWRDVGGFYFGISALALNMTFTESFVGIHLGDPCNTFSRARKPPPLGSQNARAAVALWRASGLEKASVDFAGRLVIAPLPCAGLPGALLWPARLELCLRIMRQQLASSCQIGPEGTLLFRSHADLGGELLSAGGPIREPALSAKQDGAGR